MAFFERKHLEEGEEGGSHNFKRRELTLLFLWAHSIQLAFYRMPLKMHMGSKVRVLRLLSGVLLRRNKLKRGGNFFFLPNSVLLLNL